MAVFRVGRRQGNDDIRFDTDAVDFAAIRRPILGDGHFDSRCRVDGEDALDGPLAVGLDADDGAEFHVLDGTGDDFRSAGRIFIDRKVNVFPKGQWAFTCGKWGFVLVGPSIIPVRPRVVV